MPQRRAPGRRASSSPARRTVPERRTLRAAPVVGIGVYAAVSLLHVVILATGPESWEYPTKLALMPAIALAVLLSAPGSKPNLLLLFVAILFSWLGDGAGVLLPFISDELAAMLAAFGLAHIAYIALFLTLPNRRPLPVWTLLYALWWGALLAVLWSHVSPLLAAVVIYGAILALTAASSARGNIVTAAGGLLFLASDTLLAVRLFLPGVLPMEVTSPVIMLTYCAGQGLLAFGIVQLLRSPTPKAAAPG